MERNPAVFTEDLQYQSKLLGFCGGNWSYTHHGYSSDSLQIVPMQQIFN